MNMHVGALSSEIAADDEGPATVEQMAKLEFEAWPYTDEEWKPPTNEEWANLANPHLVMVRIAWITMHKSKEELIEVISGLEESDVIDATMDGIDNTADYFDGLAQLMRGAQARMLCAGSMLAVAEGGV